MKKFRDYDQNQILLFPPSVQDWISDDHPVKYIDEVIENLNLSAIYDSYIGSIGFVKEQLNLSQFLLRGLEKVRNYWRFTCAVANFMKLYWVEWARQASTPSYFLLVRCWLRCNQSQIAICA